MATGNSGKRGRPARGDRSRARGVDGVAQRVADSVSDVVDEVADKVVRKVGQTSDQLAAKVGHNPRLVAKIDERTGQLAEQIERKRDQARSKIDAKTGRVVAKIAQKQEKLSAKAERLAPAVETSYDFWTRSRPHHRRPRFTRESIAEAALRVVETEGIDALSMRRLAAELDAGTMTLYHYVRTKDELYALLADRVMAELILDDDDFPEPWREALTAVARRTREVMRRYPWMFDIASDPGIGPNGLRHFDQSLRALAGLDLPLQQRLDILTTVDEYVFGHCLHRHSDPSASDDEWQDMATYVLDLATGGDYPQLGALVDEYGADRLWQLMRAYERDDEARFERNLTRILDGIERDLAS
jgi:AcrR family transcriptional regulator